MNTSRFPRTLQDAFGPYTDDRLCEPSPALFAQWMKWRAEHARPETNESIQQSAVAERQSMQIRSYKR